MKQIEVKVLNTEVIPDTEKMAVAMARMTQRGEKIKTMADLQELIDKPFTTGTLKTMTSLPHPTLQKFSMVNIGITGASRRFLSQITRHQYDVHFMSGSLQYSDWSDQAQFCVPYEITAYDAVHPVVNLTQSYLDKCLDDLHEYEELAKFVGRDAAGYEMPQGMRNVLIISAVPFEWRHMISQRSCKRNTLETQYVLLRCWEELKKLSPMFDDCGPACINNAFGGHCMEGKMCCDNPPIFSDPRQIINDQFKYLGGAYL